MVDRDITQRPKAVIYARVSSAKQTTRGDGLSSQETRCCEYARYKGYEVHLQLRTALIGAGGKLESPSIEFGKDSDSILVENLLASVSQNGEQTVNRMRARALNGYWVFQAPVGYEYSHKRGHGKILVRKEPVATILQEALEGYAAGRLETQVEVKRFLESFPEFPKDTATGLIHNQRIYDILIRPIYAGYLEVPKMSAFAKVSTKG